MSIVFETSEVLLAAAMIAALVPAFVVSLECLIAAVSRWPERWAGLTARGDSLRLAVVIPAHNEEAGLARTLERVIQQLSPDDRIVVVADNCTDRTAEIARGFNVEVVERFNAQQRGKGYALDAGLRFLDAAAPDVVIIVDADCAPEAGSLFALADQVARTGRPAQAVYLMEPPPSPTSGDRLSAFAFLVKNLVRPLGLSKLRGPCLLTGTGMAFPWEQIRGARLASGNIVEDMQLGLDLTLAGHPPLLCPSAVVTSRLPSHDAAARQQRRRWEHGHLETIRRQLPRLISGFLRRPRLATLAIALELSVPPLSMLAGLWIGLTAMALLMVKFSGNAVPLILAGAAWTMLTAALAATWLRFGRRIVPAPTIGAIPLYVARKAGLYWSAIWSPERRWVRTDRETRPAPDSDQPGAAPPANDVMIGRARINNVTMDEAIACMEGFIRRRKPTLIVTPNVDHVVRLESDVRFRAAYEDAELSLADGMPLLWAAKLLKTPLKEKVSGSDLFPRFCDVAGRKGYRLYFLGGRPGAADLTAEKLRRAYPDIQIATDCPPFGFEHDPDENLRIVERIREFAPDVLFVGLGAPKQELWMHRNYLDCGVPVSAGIGACFEFESGYVRRAPVVFQRTGFEWLWRLLSEPRRMYRRYLIEDPKFLGILWRQIRARRSAVGTTPVPAAVLQE